MYETEEYRDCLLCATEKQANRLISAFEGVLQIASLHVEAMGLILHNASEEQRKDNERRTRETLDKVINDLRGSKDILAAASA